jgi:hypothetical protein
VRCSYIEEDEFVGALFIIIKGVIDRVARIPEIEKADAFDHPSILDIETGNYSLC